MTTDRDEALRRAETLLRQGQLDAAIAQYTQLVDAHPTDWTSLNALGDLFVRAGSPERAVPLYTRVADGYLSEGFFARAAGFYKKVLKFVPDSEDTLLKLASSCAHQSLRADARKYLQLVANARHRRRDAAGLAAVLCNLDDLDPNDFAGRLAALRALAPLQPPQAVTRLRNLATDLEARERNAEASGVWQEVLKIDPDDGRARVRLARTALTAGDAQQAMDLLSVASIEQPDELELFVEAHVRVGRTDAARDILLSRVREQPAVGYAVLPLVARVFGPGADAFFTFASVWARGLADGGDSQGAIQVLVDFTQQYPNHRDALLQIVEVASGAGFIDAMIEAQSALADLHLANDEPDRALAIAEALHAQYPEDRRHLHRLERVKQAILGDDVDWSDDEPALEPLLVEPILERAQTETMPIEVEPFGFDEEDEEDGDAAGEFFLEEPSAYGDASGETSAWSETIGAEGASEEPGPGATGASPTWRSIAIEVDLTDRLNAVASEGDAWEPAVSTASPAVGRAPAAEGEPAMPQDLEATFAALRDQEPQLAADLVALGRTYAAAGQQEQAIEAFVTAAHDPHQRYEAAISLVEVFEQRRDGLSAVEWLEHASESAPSLAKRGAVLYRLGVMLEEIGEPSRALAVLLELKAIAPAFRDVSARVTRLEASSAGGGPSSR